MHKMSQTGDAALFAAHMITQLLAHHCEKNTLRFCHNLLPTKMHSKLGYIQFNTNYNEPCAIVIDAISL